MVLIIYNVNFFLSKQRRQIGEKGGDQQWRAALHYPMGKALLPGAVSLRHPGLVPGDLKVNFSPAGVGEYPAAGHSTVVLAERIFRLPRSKCFHEEVS